MLDIVSEHFAIYRYSYILIHMNILNNYDSYYYVIWYPTFVIEIYQGFRRLLEALIAEVRPSVRPSIRPFVRPFVRPSFRLKGVSIPTSIQYPWHDWKRNFDNMGEYR